MRWLRNKTITKARQSGLPTFLIDTQQGETFGDRLAHAFAQVFEQGYQNVIAIGSDCPDLTAADLKEAADAVRNMGSALGPDQRNGVYLIAINRNQFDRVGLAQLPWQTRDTFAALKKFLTNPSILDSKQDVNHHVDLKAILANSARRFKRAVLAILSAQAIDFNYTFSLKLADTYSTLTLRGPPLK